MLAVFDAEFAGEAWEWINIHIRQHKKDGENTTIKQMVSEPCHGLHV